MELEHGLVGLAAVLLLGFAARWIAWFLRLPSILLLLLIGVVVGPGLLWLQPDELFGEALIPFVSLSVALILFEGGLGLDFRQIRGRGGVVRNLITIGAAITWAAATAAAYYFLDFSFPIALLLGSIFVVTGPTVVIPLLQQVRPKGSLDAVVRWEGILNDPIGALLAVLVFEAVLTGQFSAGHADDSSLHLLYSLLTGCAVGAAFAGVMIAALRWHWLPEFLDAYFALASVVAAFLASNLLWPESGLLSVTVMGVVLANQKTSYVRHIVEFKEHLRVLILSVLFILLAARIKVSEVYEIGWGELGFVLALIAIRPIAVWASTIGSNLSREEKIFLSCLAPRGIVAAAVSSIFAERLANAGYPEAERMVPAAFFAIIGTVAVYGLSAGPLARRLGLATRRPQGVLFVGAEPWVRDIAKVLSAHGLRTVLADSNWVNVSRARMAGLDSRYGAVLSRGILDELDLHGIGRLLAVTSNDEANALAAVHFAEVLGRKNVYQISPGDPEGSSRARVHPEHLQGRELFSDDLPCESFESRHSDGWKVKSTSLSEAFGYEQLIEKYGQELEPLFYLDKDGMLTVCEARRKTKPRSGQTVIFLAPPSERATAEILDM